MIDSSLIFDGTISAAGAITGVAITASATTQSSTNVLDLLVGRDLGAGHPLGIHVVVTAAFTTTNSATLQAELQVSADNAAWFGVQLSEVATAAQLIQGAPFFRATLDPNQIKNSVAGILKVPGRYLRLLYTVGTGVFSVGSIVAFVAPREDRQQYTNYPIGYSALVPAGEI